jgi:hypothetical protein
MPTYSINRDSFLEYVGVGEDNIKKNLKANGMPWLGPNISDLGEGQFAVNTVIHHRVTQTAGNFLIV